MDGESVTGQAPPSGWYPDPQVAGTMRYWDGASWSEHTASGYGTMPQGGVHAAYQRTVTSQPQLGFTDLNRQSLVAIGFAAAYLVLALTTGIVLLGIIPIMAGVQALQRKEPLAPVAMVLGVVAVAFGLMGLVG